MLHMYVLMSKDPGSQSELEETNSLHTMMSYNRDRFNKQTNTSIPSQAPELQNTKQEENEIFYC